MERRARRLTRAWTEYEMLRARCGRRLVPGRLSAGSQPLKVMCVGIGRRLGMLVLAATLAGCSTYRPWINGGLAAGVDGGVSHEKFAPMALRLLRHD